MLVTRIKKVSGRGESAREDEAAGVFLPHCVQYFVLTGEIKGRQKSDFLVSENLDAGRVQILELSSKNQAQFLNMGVFYFSVGSLFTGKKR